MLILDSQRNGKAVVSPCNDLLHFEVTRKTVSVPLLDENVNENNSIRSSDFLNQECASSVNILSVSRNLT